MKTFYSTFITGFSEVVEQSLLHSLKDVKIEMLSDGLVIYQTSSNINMIKRLRFFNNSFLLLKNFPKLGSNPINLMFKKIINDKDIISNIQNFTPKKKKTFRIMATIENQFVAMDKNLLSRLENFISRKNGLVLDRSKPDSEFLFAIRREGYGLFGLRLTRHTSYEKTLEKGELYPEIAHILCLISEPNADDIFLDPFCGSGAIPLARAVGFPYRIIYAGDIEKSLIGKVENRAKKAQLKIVTGQWNALKLNKFNNNSIDKIVTDPPWGIRLTKELNLEEFYKDMLVEFLRVIKVGGLLVILVAKKDLFEAVLDKLTDRLTVLKKYDTLVSGQKAGSYKIRKL